MWRFLKVENIFARKRNIINGLTILLRALRKVHERRVVLVNHILLIRKFLSCYCLLFENRFLNAGLQNCITASKRLTFIQTCKIYGNIPHSYFCKKKVVFTYLISVVIFIFHVVGIGITNCIHLLILFVLFLTNVTIINTKN